MKWYKAAHYSTVMFIVYVYNVSKLVLQGRLLLFADDTAIHVLGEIWDDINEQSACNLKILSIGLKPSTDFKC